MDLNTQKSHLEALITRKKAVKALNNEIHDTLASIAIEKFKRKYPEPPYQYPTPNTGKSGIDITVTHEKSHPVLVAEVKGSLVTSKKGVLNGQQFKAIRKDLETLNHKGGELEKVLVILDEATKAEIRRYFNNLTNYPTIRVFNALLEDF